jgi:hypothetical protein
MHWEFLKLGNNYMPKWNFQNIYLVGLKNWGTMVEIGFNLFDVTTIVNVPSTYIMQPPNITLLLVR